MNRPRLPTIPQTSDCSWYPLSSVQRQLFAIQCARPASVVDNMPVAFRLSGAVEAEQLFEALRAVMQKNSTLRTIYQLHEGVPRQTILDTFEPVFALETVAPLPLELALKGFLQPFDLKRECPIRARLQRLSTTDWLLQLDIHRIAADSGSHDRICRELFQAYAGEPLLPEKLRYVDYVIWSSEGARASEAEINHAYWTAQYAEFSSVLELPIDFKPTVDRNFDGQQAHFDLGIGLTAGLRQLATAEGTSLHCVLLALWKLLLSRIGASDTVSVGMVVSTRDHAELKEVAGLFVNTLPLRSRANPEETFRAFLQQVRQVLREGVAHHCFALDQLVDRMGRNQSGDRSPLFDAMFTYRSSSFDHGENDYFGQRRLVGEILVEEVPAPPVAARYGLTLDVRLVDQDVWCTLEYAVELFTPETVERMGRKFARLAEQVVHDPKVLLGQVSVVDEDEEARLKRWSEGAERSEQRASIQTYFREQVEKSPTAVAISSENEALSYRQLDEWSDAVASHLTGKIAPGTIVPIVAERRTETVVGMLGILKAGGAYLPLDPEHSEEQLRSMIADSECPMVLVCGVAPEWCAEKTPIDLLSLNRYNVSDEAELPRGCGKNLAYVMYSSNAEGRAKGVLVEHQSVVRLVIDADYVELKTGRCVLQTGSLGIDPSPFEVWGSLLNGLELRLANDQVLRHSSALQRELVEHDVSHLWLTTEFFNHLVEADASTFAGVAEVLVGGDVVSAQHVSRAQRVCPETVFIHGYGPTENTTFSVCGKIDQLIQGSVPLGQPIAGSTAYVLDPGQKLCPIGGAGELYLGGRGVARGYLNQPALTAEKFVNDPFSEDPDARLYRTGDLVKWRNDGRIEFLRRLKKALTSCDRQIEPTGNAPCRLAEATWLWSSPWLPDLSITDLSYGEIQCRNIKPV